MGEVVVFVRVVATPPGEAPEEVRREWVGLDLPLAGGEIGARRVRTGGVLTGPRTFLAKLVAALTGRTGHSYGYVIDAPQALVLLAEKSPRAARWWRDYAPHCWQPGSKFVFAEECCVEIDRSEVGRPADEGQVASEDFYPAAPPEVTRKLSDETR
jgi:hypothetical protein